MELCHSRLSGSLPRIMDEAEFEFPTFGKTLLRDLGYFVERWSLKTVSALFVA